MALELLFYHAFTGNDEKELPPEEKKRRGRRTPRIAIQKYPMPPFLYLFSSGDDQALMSCCAAGHKVFCQLLALLEPMLYACARGEKLGGPKQRRCRPQEAQRREMLRRPGLWLWQQAWLLQSQACRWGHWRLGS